MAATRTEPIRIRTHSDELGCDVSRIVAYTKRCSCGKRSPGMSTVEAAREWCRLHTAIGHRD